MAGTSNFGNLLSDAANGAATLEKISQLGMLNDMHGDKKIEGSILFEIVLHLSGSPRTCIPRIETCFLACFLACLPKKQVTKCGHSLRSRQKGKDRSEASTPQAGFRP